MNKKVIFYSIMAALAISAWFFTHSDAAAIRRVFSEIERISSRQIGETALEDMAKARALSEYIENGCVFSIEGYFGKSSVSRENLAGGILSFRTDAGEVNVSFSDLQISVGSDSALASGVVAVHTGRDGDEKRKFAATLVKGDGGKWRFSSVSAWD